MIAKMNVYECTVQMKNSKNNGYNRFWPCSLFIVIVPVFFFLSSVISYHLSSCYQQVKPCQPVTLITAAVLAYHRHRYLVAASIGLSMFYSDISGPRFRARRGKYVTRAHVVVVPTVQP